MYTSPPDRLSRPRLIGRGYEEWGHVLMDARREARRREQEKELKRAKYAASSGDPEGAVAALHGSSYLKGLTINIKNKWSSLPGADIEDAVAEAIQTFYFSVKDGKKITNIGAYLWKAVDNGANKVHKGRDREKTKDEKLEYLHEGFSPSVHRESAFWEAEQDDESEELDQERTLTEAIATARRLLPRLGQVNVQRVMAYIIEVVEEDPYLIDIPNSDIAEALGMSVDAAKQSKSRGFRRLTSIAKEEGLIAEGFDLEDLVPESAEDEEIEG